MFKISLLKYFLFYFRFIICVFIVIILLSTSYEYYLKVIKGEEETLGSSKKYVNRDKETDILLKSVRSASAYSTKQNGTALQTAEDNNDITNDQPKSGAVLDHHCNYKTLTP